MGEEFVCLNNPLGVFAFLESLICVLLFCDSPCLSFTNSIFQHKGAHKCIWHQDILGHRSMINLVVSSDLRPYILNTRVTRRAELSTDHHLIVSWIRWQEEDARQTRQSQTWNMYRGFAYNAWQINSSERASLHTSKSLLTRSQPRWGTLSHSGPCSASLPLNNLNLKKCSLIIDKPTASLKWIATLSKQLQL